MPNFWDLPKAVRKRIYRLHLLQNDPVTYDDFKEICGCTQSDDRLLKELHGNRRCETKLMPNLLQAARKIDREASQIYYGGNSFTLFIPKEIAQWQKRLWRRHLNLIQSVVVEFWESVPWKMPSGKVAPYNPKYDAAFRMIGGLKSLQNLTIMVDEKAVLDAILEASTTIEWHSSLGYGPQINIKLLNFSGMTRLRSIRGLRHLEFLRVDTSSTQIPKEQGSVDGGLLETTIRQEVMLPRSAKRYTRVGHFRFLDLPAEVRNMIYSLVLTFPGPTYPISGLPTSVTSQYIQLREEHKQDLPVPGSALGILCTNHQIHQEARKLFYHDNELVFSAPVDLQSFLYTLGSIRLDSLRNVTLFYIGRRKKAKTDSSRVLKLKDAVLSLRLLPGLRKFHLLIESPWRLRDPGDEENPADMDKKTYPSYLPCAEGLFKLRNLTDIACRHLPAEDWKNNPRSQTEPGKDMSGAYKHFSHGLQLAQKGSVNSKLYTNQKWYKDELWPVLDGSDCGVRKGCMCGSSEDAPE